jgi:hypothetical protein
LRTHLAPWLRTAAAAAVLFLLGSALATPCHAGSDKCTEEDSYCISYFPAERLYDPYLADPWQERMSINFMGLPRESIADTSGFRMNLKIGGSFGFLRLTPPDDPNGGWEISMEAGFNSQSDARNSLDIIGWDGVAGFLAMRRLPHGLSLRLSPYLHRSAHIGDELIQRTGRKRIDYTREETAAGLSWNFRRFWRIYGDAGYAFTRRSEYQDIWRVQGGAEFVNPGLFASHDAGFYAAVNATSWQEKGWNVALSAATGFIFPRADRVWRLGMMVHRGTVPLGEFFRNDETFISIGAWLDL